MRRKDRELAEARAKAILQKGSYGILSTIGADGFPYGVPISYAFEENQMMFHCAKDVGKKLENLRFDSKVSFTVVGETQVLPDKFATNYESVIVQGVVVFLTGESKKAALSAIVRKYSADYLAEGEKYIQKAAGAVDVGVIDIKTITGKARY